MNILPEVFLMPAAAPVRHGSSGLLDELLWCLAPMTLIGLRVLWVHRDRVAASLRQRGRRRNNSLAILLTLGLSLLVTGTALAHASFVKSDPAPNSASPTPPQRVTIWFTEPLEPSFSRIQVLASDGSQVDRGDSAFVNGDPTVLSVGLNDLPEGTYIVSWQVLSTIDGHITSGAFPFAVGDVAPGGAIAAATLEVPPVSLFDVAARGIGYLAQAALAGALAFRLFVLWPALKRAEIDESEIEPAVSRRSTRVILVAIAGLVVSTALWLLAQLSLSGLTLGGWLATRVGRIWIGRAATVVALAVLADDLALMRRPISRQGWLIMAALVWLSAQLLAVTTLTSHSAAVPNPILPMLSDWIHLLATSIWIGGLIQMVLVLPAALRSLDAEDRAWLLYGTVLNFSTLAAFGVGALLISGVYLGTLHVGPPAALFETDYGRTLLFKIALVVPALLLGALNLLYVKPRLDRALDEPESRSAVAVQRRYKRLVTVEAAVAASVVVIAGLLSVLPRGRDPQPTASAAAPIELSQDAEDVRVDLRIAPARVGVNEYDVKVTDKAGRPVDDASRVSLRFKPIGMTIGTSEVDATPGGGGVYKVSGANISLNGTWQIEIAVRRPNAFDQFAAFRVQAEGDGRIVALTGQPDPIDNLARLLDIYGTPIGAAGVLLMALLWLFIAFRAAGPRLWAVLGLATPSMVFIPISIVSLITFLQDTTPTAGLLNPIVPDVESIARGQALYEQNCAVCHGPEGTGDGPAAAQLNPRPADFTAGHTDSHPDGDVFYWIENGFPNSDMPAFKDRLSEEDIWHTVNYVRRLSVQAVETAAAPFTPTIPIVTPLPTAPSEPAALGLLRRADAAMNALRSLVEKQTLSDDAGNQIAVVFTYAAPDRLRYQIVNGATAIQIGPDDYQLRPDGTWIKNQRAVPVAWPNFFYSTVAGNARLDGEEQIGDAATTIVAFNYAGFDFRYWIDQATDRILKLTMDGSNHHMVSTYGDFGSAPEIEPPIP